MSLIFLARLRPDLADSILDKLMSKETCTKAEVRALLERQRERATKTIDAAADTFREGLNQGVSECGAKLYLCRRLSALIRAQPLVIDEEQP